METPKRERSANFNAAEVQLLVSLVNKHKQVIENKKTDAVTNKDKESAWRKIEYSFNSCGIAPNVRSWKTLKLKYEGLKKSTKKKSSLQRQEMYRTGGGPSNAPQFDNIEEQVLSICSNIQGMDARNDSDNITEPIPVEEVNIDTNNFLDVSQNISFSVTDTLDEHETDQANVKIPDMDESLILEINTDDDSQKENKWNKWNPKALKTRVSSVLRSDTATKAGVTCKLDKLSTARLELVQMQKEIALKEHEFALKEHHFIEEQHKVKLQNLANDERRKEEIHALLMQKLRSGPVSSDMI